MFGQIHLTIESNPSIDHHPKKAFLFSIIYVPPKNLIFFDKNRNHFYPFVLPLQ